MDQKTTGELMQLLSSAKNISDLKQYTDALADMTSSVTFPEYLNELMHARRRDRLKTDLCSPDSAQLRLSDLRRQAKSLP